MARFSSRVTRLSSQRLFVRSQAKIFLMNMMINGTGTRFPMIATGIAHQKGRPCATAIGIAPRSSTTGTMEIRNVMTSLPKKLFQRVIVLLLPYFFLMLSTRLNVLNSGVRLSQSITARPMICTAIQPGSSSTMNTICTVRMAQFSRMPSV